MNSEGIASRISGNVTTHGDFRAADRAVMPVIVVAA